MLRQRGSAAEGFEYCDSLVSEAHAWEVTRPMLDEQCVLPIRSLADWVPDFHLGNDSRVP